MLRSSQTVPDNNSHTIAFINPSSGGHLGRKVFFKLQSILGDDSVFDLSKQKPEAILKSYVELPKIRIIACGGDGTVVRLFSPFSDLILQYLTPNMKKQGWILSTIERLPFSEKPMVVPFPLGTGNDMSRVLQWGPTYSGQPIMPIIQAINAAIPIPMDQWQLDSTDLSFTEMLELKRELPSFKRSMKRKKTEGTITDPESKAASPNETTYSSPATTDTESELDESPMELDWWDIPISDYEAQRLGYYDFSPFTEPMYTSDDMISDNSEDSAPFRDWDNTDTEDENGSENETKIWRPNPLRQTSSGSLSPRPTSPNTSTNPFLSRPMRNFRITPNNARTLASSSPTCFTKPSISKIRHGSNSLSTSAIIDNSSSSSSNNNSSPSNSRGSSPKPAPRHVPSHYIQVRNAPLSKSFAMNNYFSIGADSKVALSFHKMRHNSPNLFANPVVNKAWYGILGVKEALSQFNITGLRNYVKLELDGQVVELPKKIVALVFLQIPSYGSGTNAWGNAKIPDNQVTRPLVCDKMFEVFGLKSVMHMGWLHAGLANGTRIGQAKHAVVSNRISLPVQCDGEPWLLAPCKTTVTFKAQTCMLFNILAKNGERKIINLTGKSKEEHLQEMAEEDVK